MPKPKNNSRANKPGKNKKEKDESKLKNEDSSLGDFVKRSLPTDEEVKKFDNFAEEEIKDEDIEDSLSEIYQDDNGDMVNVQELDIKKGRGFLFWFVTIVFLVAVLVGGGYVGYNYYLNNNPQGASVEFSIASNENLVSGEEFFYTIDYKNFNNVGISNIDIKLSLPENFVFLDSLPEAGENNDWHINYLESHRSGQIKIKGKLIGPEDESNIITGVMTYMPDNFSSEFKEEASFENEIIKTGIDLNIENDSGVLLNEDSTIRIKYKLEEESYMNNFRLTIEPIENLEFTKDEDGKINNGVWNITEITEEEEELDIKFRITDKLNDSESLILKFEYIEDGEKSFEFFNKTIEFEVIKNDLNLNLIINGSRNDKGIDFGQTLNYSIVYANKGESEMKDVVIMVVLNSEVLDWESIEDENEGQIGDNIITWTKEEIPAFEALEEEDEGVIDFTIDVLAFDDIEVASGKKYEVESYAQFSIEDIQVEGNEDTKSNTIINKLNSDISLDEQIRYYNDDNIAVGSGPLPPKVGENTDYKVYWTLSNNLNELNNLQIKVNLPDYVKWNNKNRATVGSVQYVEGSHMVVWSVGRLPISVFKAEAEFNISVTPVESDIDKILVILPGTVLEAVDSETKADISKTSKAKTTKLEDDEIAETDGRIVR